MKLIELSRLLSSINISYYTVISFTVTVLDISITKFFLFLFCSINALTVAFLTHERKYEFLFVQTSFFSKHGFKFCGCQSFVVDYSLLDVRNNFSKDSFFAI